MKNLKIHILLRKNNYKLEHCIASLLPLNGEITAIDINASKKSTDICKYFNVNVIQACCEDNFSKIRNSIDSNLYLEPWEVLTSGHKDILEYEKGSYICQVVQNKVINKEVRLWSDLKFNNPVYEAISTDGATFSPNIIIYSQKKYIENDNELTDNILEKWKLENKLNPEPFYYSACNHLMNKRYDLFLSEANKCIFYSNKINRMTTMLRYYMSVIYLYCKNDTDKSLNNIIHCIYENPAMAEFWCLLGDIHFKEKKYIQSNSFFENAMLLGKQRKNNDLFPIEISKYKEYPDKMMKTCQELIKL